MRCLRRAKELIMYMLLAAVRNARQLQFCTVGYKWLFFSQLVQRMSFTCRVIQGLWLEWGSGLGCLPDKQLCESFTAPAVVRVRRLFPCSVAAYGFAASC